jgi:DNA repair photolyase
MHELNAENFEKQTAAHDVSLCTIVPELLSEKMKARAATLQSSFIDAFDYTVYDKLASRLKGKEPRAGIIMKKMLALQNYHSSCQQCHYTFELDTYGRGCWHDCVYCYAKTNLTRRGMWNKPQPVPISIVELRDIFYTVFETNKKSKWRSILEKRIPLRLGAMSDCFMLMDKQYKVTLETLKILNYYKYPFIVFTKSDLVAADEYMKEMDPDFAVIQMSISSLNEHLNKKVEPAAPPAYKRFRALQKLSAGGFNTAVRVNPLFPIRTDGYYSESRELSDAEKAVEFPYFSWDMPEVAAQHNVKTFLIGFVRLTGYELASISTACSQNLSNLFTNQTKILGKYLTFSDAEIAYYYKRVSEECKFQGIDFSTCYIGNGEKDYWSYQGLWKNKKDCCNAVGVTKGFVHGQTSQAIPWAERLQHTNLKGLMPEVSEPNFLEQTTPIQRSFIMEAPRDSNVLIGPAQELLASHMQLPMVAALKKRDESEVSG